MYIVVNIHKVYTWYARCIYSMYSAADKDKKSCKWRPQTTMLGGLQLVAPSTRKVFALSCCASAILLWVCPKILVPLVWTHKVAWPSCLIQTRESHTDTHRYSLDTGTFLLHHIDEYSTTWTMRSSTRYKQIRFVNLCLQNISWLLFTRTSCQQSRIQHNTNTTCVHKYFLFYLSYSKAFTNVRIPRL